jgi:hypothetical protein
MISSSLILASILSLFFAPSHAMTSAIAVVVAELIRRDDEGRPPSSKLPSLLFGGGI